MRALFVIGIYLLMSTCAFAMYWADKRRAGGGAWRISEATLPASVTKLASVSRAPASRASGDDAAAMDGVAEGIPPHLDAVRTRIRPLFDNPAARSGFVASVTGKEVGLN